MVIHRIRMSTSDRTATPNRIRGQLGRTDGTLAPSCWARMTPAAATISRTGNHARKPTLHALALTENRPADTLNHGRNDAMNAMRPAPRPIHSALLTRAGSKL